MFSLCPIHSVADNATVSLAIKDALKNNTPVTKVVVLVIVRPDEDMKKEYILVDSDLVKSLGMSETERIVLLDRDRDNKKLNDRLLIRKIAQHLCSVCPICLWQKLGLKIPHDYSMAYK